jgi:myo-inositol catabolism protein IolC
MARAIQELEDAGVEPDIWKVEGLDRREGCGISWLLLAVTAEMKSAASSSVGGADERK